MPEPDPDGRRVSRVSLGAAVSEEQRIEPRAGSQPIKARRCHATNLGASLARRDRWRGRHCHVTGQHPRSSPCHSPAAPPCMARHRRFVAP